MTMKGGPRKVAPQVPPVGLAGGPDQDYWDQVLREALGEQEVPQEGDEGE